MIPENPQVTCVVASNRPAEFGRFVDAWWDEGADAGYPWGRTILIRDADLPRFGPDIRDPKWAAVEQYGWADIKAENDGVLPEWLSRRDSGIKCWGFLRAVQGGADVVITLDDDCLPCSRRHFVADHLGALRASRWTTTVPWLFPRGIPYPGGLGVDELPVAVNMGLWTNVPDIDAVTALTRSRSERPRRPGEDEWEPAADAGMRSQVVPRSQYWPMSGMNLAFRREVAPLMYFPRMGEGAPFARFDDIWGGIVAQKCMRHLDLDATVGRPMVRHDRASDPFVNLVKEAPGIKANQEFWRAIDAIRFDPDVDTTPLACMGVVGRYLLGDQGYELDYEAQDATLRGYLPNLGAWILEWCSQFDDPEWGMP